MNFGDMVNEEIAVGIDPTFEDFGQEHRDHED
jgi:hypothetical protein